MKEAKPTGESTDAGAEPRPPALIGRSGDIEGSGEAPRRVSAKAAAATASLFAAHLLGQSGGRRGLKAGPPALDEAKTRYLGAEWSGPRDRRRKTGRIAKTEV